MMNNIENPAETTISSTIIRNICNAVTPLDPLYVVGVRVLLGQSKLGQIVGPHGDGTVVSRNEAEGINHTSEILLWLMLNSFVKKYTYIRYTVL